MARVVIFVNGVLPDLKAVRRLFRPGAHLLLPMGVPDMPFRSE